MCSSSSVLIGFQTCYCVRFVHIIINIILNRPQIILRREASNSIMFCCRYNVDKSSIYFVSIRVFLERNENRGMIFIWSYLMADHWTIDSKSFRKLSTNNSNNNNVRIGLLIFFTYNKSQPSTPSRSTPLPINPPPNQPPSRSTFCTELSCLAKLVRCRICKYYIYFQCTLNILACFVFVCFLSYVLDTFWETM